MKPNVPTASQAADAVGILTAFALSALPKDTRREIGIALQKKTGTFEIVLAARSPVDYEQRIEFFDGKRKRLLKRIPMRAPE